MTPRILVVDDDPDLCAELERLLSRRGHDVVARTSAEDALAVALGDEVDLVLTDLRMGQLSRVELCRRVVEQKPDLPVVVLTAFGSVEAAVATTRAGAFDFLTKPFTPAQLDLAIARALEHRRLRLEVRRLGREARARRPDAAILGEGRAMTDVLDFVDRVAETDATVLVTGESGTGKELVARAVHARSRRAAGPLVAINCAAMPEALLESELFGHVKGAFTDAKSAKRGLFLEAQGGTLFLDEIGEMPLGLQAKLLRALEDRKVRPLGATAEVPFDARLVAATNRDLETRVAEKAFREDLYYRVHVVHVDLPPLRARGDDVLALASHFLARFAQRHQKAIGGIAPGAARRLLAYPWPGNVRELQNCVERAVALARGDTLTEDDLPPRVRDHAAADVLVAAHDPSELVTLEEVERRYIQRVMEAVGGSKSEAARVLGLDRSTLYRKLDRYGVRAPRAASDD